MAQALSLLNGDTLNGKLRSDQGAIAKAISANTIDDAIIDRLFAAAHSRRPTGAERDAIRSTLAAAVSGIKDPKEAMAARRAAVEDLYWATMTSKEFLFNH
jgi:hypothetical protein